MFVANELLKLENKVDNLEITNNFLTHLYQIVKMFISDKTMFSMDNFDAYIFDEYVLETNCHKDIFNCIYLTIDQPLNYRPSKKVSKTITKSNLNNKKDKPTKTPKIKPPDLYFPLSEIKQGLYELFLKHFDPNNIVWMDKYAICMRTSVLYDEGAVENYYFRIIPCLTKYNAENIKGLMYYNNNDVEIEYPDLALQNYLKKNKQTKDIFRKTIVIFKNILLKEKTIDRLPSEIIETLLYNVPNKLFVSTNKQDLINIINFIRNNPINLFKTIDEQDYAFTSIYRSMSLYYCKHILKLIEKYLINS
ncbi:MAG: hypothetical protein IJW59_04610 [Clostridia bacterium]|nr:hypothetical protein [Clostridia bacterium]